MTHACRPNRALGVARSHDVEPETTYWCGDCHRLWVKTTLHHSIHGKDVCGCGWAMIGVFTNAATLERFFARLDRAYRDEGVEHSLSRLTARHLAEIIAQDRESH